MRSLGGRVVSWSEYVEALCCRFGGEKTPLEELIELKQKNDLETYIKDFDILSNRSEISEKNALVFFIGGLDVEVKNMIKMFEPKSLKQAYTLARLQDNTLTHRRYGSNPNKQTYHPTTFAYPNKPATLFSYNKNFPTGFPSTSPKPPQAGLLPNPPYNPNITQRTTRPIRNRDLDESRAKGLCFWCDEKFIPGHRCQNKKLYSLCIMEDSGEGSEDEGATDLDPNTYNPHLSLNALKGVTSLNTLRVIGKIEKQPIVFLIDSGSTHNFISNHVADRLHCNLTNIKALTVQVADGGIMDCTSMCSNFQWSIQGVDFVIDVFTLDLKNCDMILGIQWLATLKTIVCNYEEMWMAFTWQGQEVFIKGNDPVTMETVRLKQLNGLLCSANLVSKINLCSLRSINSQERGTGLQPGLAANTVSPLCRQNTRSCLQNQRAYLLLVAMITIYLLRKALIQSISDPIDTPVYKRMW